MRSCFGVILLSFVLSGCVFYSRPLPPTRELISPEWARELPGTKVKYRGNDDMVIVTVKSVRTTKHYYEASCWNEGVIGSDFYSPICRKCRVAADIIFVRKDGTEFQRSFRSYGQFTSVWEVLKTE